MHANIGLHERYALVSPQDFSSEMDRHWTKRLGMCSSPALRSLWTIMADTFKTSIIDTIKGREAPWRILQPPTGSGKTQGACLYASMQAKLNDSSDGHLKPVGMMIVTRLREQADTIVNTINELAGRAVAVAHHSSRRATPDELHERCVLVITHQAYVNASEDLKSGQDARWERLVSWKGGQRVLTIIDEALANVVESNKISVSNLGMIISCIPLALRAEFPDQINALETVHKALTSIASEEPDGETNNARMAWGDSGGAHALSTVATNMAPLRTAMKSLPYDRIVLGKDSDHDRIRLAQRFDTLLLDVQAVLERWAYYARKGNEHYLNSSAFLIPSDTPGPVVLDATARDNFLWELFGSRAEIIPVPDGARNYSNVTLHVARASGIGKHSMAKHIKRRYPRLLENLERELGPKRSVFLCLHAGVEHVAQSYRHGFAQLKTGHWGAIDGRNDWADCDTAVIFGLSYRDHIWSTNLFFALQGSQDDAWLKSPSWGAYKDVRRVMEQRQLSVSIVQAINRICCRRVIDAQGRSPPADIYIVLPKDRMGDAILADIQADMPGLRVVSWDFELDGAKVRKARSGTSHESLLTLMRHRLPGETSIAAVARELGLSDRQTKRLRETLSDHKHVTTTALREMGVLYVVRGAGRGARSSLIKETAH